jgi:hypothetical protein
MTISKVPVIETFKMDNKTTATTNCSIRSIKPMHYFSENKYALNQHNLFMGHP